MEFLIIGISSIVRRRVLPALFSLDEVDKIHLASRREQPPDIVHVSKRGQVFRNYSDALAQLQPCTVYISLPNSMHGEWAKRALGAGFHVIVDKPSVTSLAEAEALLGLALSRRLCIAEAVVWSFHPQIEATKSLFREAGEESTRISATFSFPPLSPTNFRYSAELGGGSLFDLGPYAVSCGRVFFGEPPAELFCRIHSRLDHYGVDTSFSLMACYRGGRAMVGHFGFNTEYKNALSLLSSSVSVDIDRAFTMPAETSSTLRVKRKNEPAMIVVNPGDSFALFLAKVLRSMHDGSYDVWSEALWQDAEVLHRARVSAGEVDNAD